jgi:PIN domain nuclease of toxin-antitoxin system
MASAEAVVLDTHVWKMLVDGDRFAPRVLRKIDAAARADALYVAAVSIWELAMLVAKGALRLNGPTLQWITEAVHASRVAVFPLEPSIAVDAAELAGFHGDPADRMIAATARHLGATLVTRDAKLLDYAAETRNLRVIEPR